MKWSQYLALLNWQGQKVSSKDILSLAPKIDTIKSPEDLPAFLSHPQTKNYVSENKTWWKQCELEAKQCKQNGIQLTWPGQPDWPLQLNIFDSIHSLLSYKGQASAWNENFQLCLVGSRKSHSSTLSWMDHHLSPFIQNQKKISVLSGGARGIDQKAHSIAIRFGLPTLCFLPCGLNSIYPPSLESWVQPILNNHGAFISPFPPHYRIRKSFFHYRNALMVKMAHIVFVLQAEEKSGSMLTAKLAANLGKTLCTLPGPVMNPLFRGNLNLISDGILVIKDQKDLEVLFYVENELNQISKKHKVLCI